MKDLILFILILTSVNLLSIEFKYKWSDDYRIESIVYQNVKYNNEIVLSSVIENRYIINILDVFDETALINVIQAVYQDSKGTGFYTHSERNSGDLFQDAQGGMEPVTSIYFPSVQGIPYFPEKNICNGEKWISKGVEFFDLNNSFKIDYVLKADFNVFYTYLGSIEIEDRKIEKIKVNYNIFEEIFPELDWPELYPKEVSASSNQILYWDNELGRVYALDDKFSLRFVLSNDDVYLFSGTTDSYTYKRNNLENSDFRSFITKINKKKDIEVKENSQEVKIVYRTLLFDPESWILKDEVKEYLDDLGKSLKQLKDVNIRISGHTALLPDTEEAYVRELSLNRGISVAEYLVKHGYINKRDIEIVGFGGDKPVATNDSSEGRMRNRRVEIDILKNN